jgi:hypothetical protein
MHNERKSNPAYDKAFAAYLRYGTPITVPYYLDEERTEEERVYLKACDDMIAKCAEQLAILNRIFKKTQYSKDIDIPLLIESITRRLNKTIEAKHNFNPNQPRAPAGQPDGGQWVDATQSGNGQQPAAKPKQKLNFAKALKVLKENAIENEKKKKRRGKCARFVRIALEDGGGLHIVRPKARVVVPGDEPNVHARDFGPSLVRAGFVEIIEEFNGKMYPPLAGDVAVMQPYEGGNQSGHMQMYDGQYWISDYIQRGFWPGVNYAKHKPPYAIYRYPDAN